MKGALSGSMDLEITTETPLFIRGEETNESKKTDSDHHCYDFFKHAGKYCIPGSSIKGMISSLVSIFGFGKIGPINDVRYSQRDWNNPKIYKKSDFQNVNGGWLSRDENGDYIIKYSPENIGRIAHWHIDSEFSTQFSKDFKSSSFQQDDEYKSAKKKYDLFELKGNEIEKCYSFKEESDIYIEKSKTRYYSISKGGDKIGRLVFTGQPVPSSYEKGNKRNKKYSEFIFWEPTMPPENVNHLIDDFFMAYLEHDPGNRKPDWNFWREKLQEGGEVPVFVTVEHNKIKHFGLSKLYKLPFENSVGKLMHEDHHNPDYDLTETIFGTASVTDGGLKGRVAIQNAYAPFNTVSMPERTLVLSQPKASFYPFYVKQEFRSENTIKNSYNTYNNAEATIAGRKYYPMKSVTGGSPKNQLSTSFKPVPRNTVFKGKIVFHNLLPQELGALQCAITINDTDTMHSLGMAKPYGYGAVHLKISGFEVLNHYCETDGRENKEKTFWSCMYTFREMMQGFYNKGNWNDSPPIHELLAMAGKKHDSPTLEYMTLSITPRQNDYAEIKEEPQQALPRFSNFLNIQAGEVPKSPATNSPFTKLDAAQEAEELVQKEKAIQNKIDQGLEAHLSFVQGTYENLENGMTTWFKDNKITQLENKIDIDTLLEILVQCRKKTPNKHRDKWLGKNNRREDIIGWAGKEALDKFEKMIKNK